MKTILVYRGESRNYHEKGEPFKPSIYRDVDEKESVFFVNKYIQATYEKYRELAFFDKMNIESDTSEEVKAKNRLKRLGVMQHYGMDSPLLDLSESEDVALYFACNSHFECDGYLYAFEESKMAGLDTIIVQRRMRIVWDYVKSMNEDRAFCKSLGRRGYCFDYTKLFATGEDNIRYKNQSGRFYLHHYNIDNGVLAPCFLQYVEPQRVIARNDKIIVLLELAISKRITREFIFPDKEECIQCVREYNRAKILGKENLENKTFFKNKWINEKWCELLKILSKTLEGYIFIKTDLYNYYRYLVDMKIPDSDITKSINDMKKTLYKMTNVTE